MVIKGLNFRQYKKEILKANSSSKETVCLIILRCFLRGIYCKSDNCKWVIEKNRQNDNHIHHPWVWHRAVLCHWQPVVSSSDFKCNWCETIIYMGEELLHKRKCIPLKLIYHSPNSVKDVKSKTNKQKLVGMITHEFGSLTVSMFPNGQRMKQRLNVEGCFHFEGKKCLWALIWNWSVVLKYLFLETKILWGLTMQNLLWWSPAWGDKT